jgi:fusion protein PurCD
MTRVHAVEFGKVRNSIILSDNRRILHTTDRISAFDSILPFQIPGKGALLQAMSIWFFERTRDIVPNHVLGVLDDNHLLVRNAQVLPVEFVVRGFLTGSLWRLYKAEGPEGVRSVYGVDLPAGLTENCRLENPILTPTTKEKSGHDRPITLEEGDRLFPQFTQAATIAITLFRRGQELSESKGLLLVDAKYEMGIAAGKLILVDEIHTPDCARYWKQDDVGQPRPRQYSKEVLREFIIEIFGGADNIPSEFIRDNRLTDSETTRAIVNKTQKAYSEAFVTITGHTSPRELLSRIAHPEWPVPRHEVRAWENEAHLPEQILVLGDGGRDYTIARTFADKAEVSRVYMHPPRTNWGPKTAPLPDCPAEADLDMVIAAAVKANVGLIIPGPEAPIVAGIASLAAREKIPTLAPDHLGARLEGSKIFCKEIAVESDLRTARHRVTSWRDLRAALVRTLASRDWSDMLYPAPCVIKYDGLAAGKGVFIIRTLDDLQTTLETLDAELSGWLKKIPPVERTSLEQTRFLIEEMLTGDEVSVIALCNGTQFRLLPLARDYKRRNDGQTGPNTGGMGAVCPLRVSAKILRQFQSIFSRTLGTMSRHNMPYRGFLYAGCMIDADENVWLLEFNCRLGDPETQVLLPGLGREFSTESWRVARGLPFWEPQKNTTSFAHDGKRRVLVVAASPEYPTAKPQRRNLTIPENLDADILPAAVDADNSTAGGRILGVMGTAGTYTAAREKAYHAVRAIRLVEGENIAVPPHFRSDVGQEFAESEL